LGVRLRVEPTESFFVQAAVYDGNPDRSESGAEITLDPEEGALVYFEGGFKLNQRKMDTGLPGTYKVGGWYHSDDFYDNYDTVLSFAGLGAGPTVHSGNYGIYATADQMLYREQDAQDAAKQGMGAFARAGYAPEDRNLVEWALDGGLVYRGLIPSRDYDSLGLTAAWMWMSSDLASGQRAVNALAPGTFKPVDYEGLVELTYKAQLTAWWTLQPSVQRVIQPGGSSVHRDAWAIIVLTTLRF
jgi:porin